MFIDFCSYICGCVRGEKSNLFFDPSLLFQATDAPVHVSMVRCGLFQVKSKEVMFKTSSRLHLQSLKLKSMKY